jgi:hypothetical protein
MRPFVRFFHARRDLLCGSEVVADVAILRSFPSQVFANSKHARLTARVEQVMIQKCTPFQIIHDDQLGDLQRYRALVLAGCVALSDSQVERIRQYVRGGGGLFIVGPAGTHDEWLRPRDKGPFDGLSTENVVRLAENDDRLDQLDKACGGTLSLSVQAPSGVCVELTQQPARRLVHLVNYREDKAAADVKVQLGTPAGVKATKVSLASPERGVDQPVAFKQYDDGVRFTVPAVRVYEIAVVDLE